jgi:hypothetical protein
MNGPGRGQSSVVVEHNGPTMMARIGVMRALNRNVVRVFYPDRKDTHWGRGSYAGTNESLELVRREPGRRTILDHGRGNHLEVIGSLSARH